MNIYPWATVGKWSAGVLLLVLLSVSACNPPKITWAKEGATQDDVTRDEKDCVAQSGNYNFVVDPATSGPLGLTDEQADVYQDCMAQRGYTSQ
jgi:hypothetical protein